MIFLGEFDSVSAILLTANILKFESIHIYFSLMLVYEMFNSCKH